MSVLIKGAKMPKKCCDCGLLPAEINWDEQWECPITEEIVHKYVEEREGKSHDCPLVEIPPHGRLIDADKLKDKINIAFLSEIGKVIDDAPTVIESEEQENE